MDRISLDIDYMEAKDYSDKCECESCRYFYREFKSKYKEIIDLLEELRIDIEYPLALMEHEDCESGRCYLVHYELKGSIPENFSIELEGLEIKFIRSDCEDTFWPSPSFQEAYFILEIDNIVL